MGTNNNAKVFLDLKLWLPPLVFCIPSILNEKNRKNFCQIARRKNFVWKELNDLKEKESVLLLRRCVMRKRKHCLVFPVACQARYMRMGEGRGWIVSAFAKGQKQLPAYVLVSADDMYCNLRPHIREAKCLPIGSPSITWLNRWIWLVKEMPFWTRGWPISCPFELCPPTQKTTIRSKNTFFSSKRPFPKRESDHSKLPSTSSYHLYGYHTCIFIL
jgi:hypothetical protein